MTRRRQCGKRCAQAVSRVENRAVELGKCRLNFVPYRIERFRKSCVHFLFAFNQRQFSSFEIGEVVPGILFGAAENQYGEWRASPKLDQHGLCSRFIRKKELPLPESGTLEKAGSGWLRRRVLFLGIVPIHQPAQFREPQRVNGSVGAARWIECRKRAAQEEVSRITGMQEVLPCGAGLQGLKSPETRKFGAQPLATRHRCAAITPHGIGLTAKTAFRGSPFNKVFGGIDQIPCRQVFVLAA